MSPQMSQLAQTNHTSLALSQAAADKALRIRLKDEFTNELAIFSGCVIGAFTAFHILRLLFALCSRSISTHPASPDSEKPDAERHTSSVDSTSRPASLRRLPLALVSLFRNVIFRTPIPFGFCASVAELTFILLYMMANFIWLFIDTKGLTRSFYQDRAAHLGAVQLSLVVALAGKNNVISFLTGVSYEKLHVLHRAATRTAVIMLWTHAISRTASVLPEEYDFSHTWMQAGAVALVSFSLVVGLSIRPIRNFAFEFFFVTHIILIALALAAAIVHTSARDCQTFIWPALLVWGLDRFIRVGRIIFNNWSGKRDPVHSTASVELLGKDTIRLTLRRRFSWKAGQHAYLILPTVSGMPTEAHPFTIASLPNGKKGEDNDLVFLIRSRRGFTARLKDLATKPTSECITVPAYVDGPYGYPPDPSTASTCVLISGGSGVSFALTLLQEAIARTTKKHSIIKRVVFIWAVRDAAHLGWISRTLCQSLSNTPPFLVVDVRVHVTGASSDIPVIDYSPGSSTPTSHESKSGCIETSDIENKAPAYDFLKIKRGRPDVVGILRNEMESATGHVQVNVAGPTPLTQSVKSALRSIAKPGAVLRGMPTVSLHVESFGMISK